MLYSFPLLHIITDISVLYLTVCIVTPYSVVKIAFNTLLSYKHLVNVKTLYISY